MKRRSSFSKKILRRLKNRAGSVEDLLDIYCKQIRSIMEFAVPVWNSAITGHHISQLERIQKSALHISLGEDYVSYNNALKLSGLHKLSERRKKLCLTFAKKALKHCKFSQWFKPNLKVTKTRQKPSKFCQVYRKTSRFGNSPISGLTEILNLHFSTKK